MAAVATHVAEEKGRIAVVSDDDIDESVVVEIREGDTAADVRSFESWASAPGGFGKFSFAFIVEQ